MTNLLLSCKLIQGLHKKKKGNSLSQLRLLVKLKHLLIARIIYYSWCKDEQSQLKRLEHIHNGHIGKKLCPFHSRVCELALIHA